MLHVDLTLHGTVVPLVYIPLALSDSSAFKISPNGSSSLSKLRRFEPTLTRIWRTWEDDDGIAESLQVCLRTIIGILDPPSTLSVLAIARSAEDYPAWRVWLKCAARNRGIGGPCVESDVEMQACSRVSPSLDLDPPLLLADPLSMDQVSDCSLLWSR